MDQFTVSGGFCWVLKEHGAVWRASTVLTGPDHWRLVVFPFEPRTTEVFEWSDDAVDAASRHWHGLPPDEPVGLYRARMREALGAANMVRSQKT